MALRAIIFDIDGVLADSRAAVVLNTKTLLHEYGINVLDSRVERMSSAHSAESVLISLVPSLEGNEALRKEMLARLSVITAQNLHLVKPTPIASKLPSLSKKYLLAAASNRKSSARMVLEKLGILRHFSAVVTSAEAPVKPDPTMIRLALQRLGVKPQEAVFIGDNKEDRLAGEAAGTKVAIIDGTNEKDWEKFEKEFLS
ncbi:Phosphoglycolate phosphatase [uncultured archaeon]|nr:Phosphoglycolate phosphatase [uncultured archaeon]